MQELLQHLLGPPTEPIGEAELEPWWAEHCRRHDAWRLPVERAIVGGFAADRLGFAFVAGYEAALRSMLPSLAATDAIVALCATEEGGAHPREIKAALEPRAGGGWLLSGRKRWTTGGTHAERLVVVASVGTDASGRNRLRLVEVTARAAGVYIEPMPPTDFTPEIPHASVRFDEVAVDEADLLEGDGYAAYLKPFRTVEDLHVNAAVLGYLLGVGRRYDWPHAWYEQTLACLTAVRALALEDPRAAVVHVAVAGALRQGAQAIAQTEELWAQSDGEERQRWQRDRGLLEVAGGVRTARRERAWRSLTG